MPICHSARNTNRGTMILQGGIAMLNAGRNSALAKLALVTGVASGALVLPVGVFTGQALAVSCYQTNHVESPQNIDNWAHGTTIYGGWARESYVRTVTLSSVDVTWQPSTLPSGGLAMGMFGPNGGAQINSTRCDTIYSSNYYTVATSVLGGTKWVFGTQQLSSGSGTSYAGYLNY
jgi:hypothetical protein